MNWRALRLKRLSSDLKVMKGRQDSEKYLGIFKPFKIKICNVIESLKWNRIKITLGRFALIIIICFVKKEFSTLLKSSGKIYLSQRFCGLYGSLRPFKNWVYGFDVKRMIFLRSIQIRIYESIDRLSKESRSTYWFIGTGLSHLCWPPALQTRCTFVLNSYQRTMNFHRLSVSLFDT